MSRKQKKIFSSVIVIVLIIAMVMGCIASFVLFVTFIWCDMSGFGGMDIENIYECSRHI